MVAFEIGKVIRSDRICFLFWFLKCDESLLVLD